MTTLREPPGFYYHRPDLRQKITVWTGYCGNGQFLSPFFVEGNLDENR